MRRFGDYDPDEKSDHGDWVDYPPAVDMWADPVERERYERLLEQYLGGEPVSRNGTVPFAGAELCRTCFGRAYTTENGELCECHACRGSGYRNSVKLDLTQSPDVAHSMAVLDWVAGAADR